MPRVGIGNNVTQPDARVCHASVGRVQLRGSGEETDIVLFRIARKI